MQSERYGPLRSVWIARKPPGFAFIEYEDVRDAEDAVRKMDGAVRLAAVVSDYLSACVPCRSIAGCSSSAQRA